NVPLLFHVPSTAILLEPVLLVAPATVRVPLVSFSVPPVPIRFKVAVLAIVTVPGATIWPLFQVKVLVTVKLATAFSLFGFDVPSIMKLGTDKLVLTFTAPLKIPIMPLPVSVRVVPAFQLNA